MFLEVCQVCYVRHFRLDRNDRILVSSGMKKALPQTERRPWFVAGGNVWLNDGCGRWWDKGAVPEEFAPRKAGCGDTGDENNRDLPVHVKKRGAKVSAS
jgi:hypothetical protein